MNIDYMTKAAAEDIYEYVLCRANINQDDRSQINAMSSVISKHIAPISDDYDRMFNSWKRDNELLYMLYQMVTHGGPVRVDKGHHCGDPNSSCDSICEEAARDAEVLEQIRQRFPSGGCAL